MIQRRHILIHNGGIVDQEYLDLSEDAQSRLGERIRVRSKELSRFIGLCLEMGTILMDNVENQFLEVSQ
jgi:erythromycin esterase-like protein